MGWGRGSKRPKWFRVEQMPERCFVYEYGCRNPPEFGCHNMGEWGTASGGFSCRLHKSSCCRPLRVSSYRSPLQDLGSWVFSHGNRIDGAPEHLLLAAFRHVEIRMMRCPHGNARARSIERWLGRWASIINNELARRSDGPGHSD